MRMDSRRTGLPLSYDLLLSILYAWCVFQTYVYDAKTQTAEILIYVMVYGVFTLLIRSCAGIIMMNLLSVISFPIFFLAPVIHHAGSYFGFQPFSGIIATVLIGLIQCLLFVPFRIFAKRLLSSESQYILSGVIAIVFALVLTIYVSVIHAFSG